jgi:broad specificity phosphatase PhoE
MNLTVVRHGETRENRHHTVMGQRPGHLSKRGKHQVREVAQELATEHFDVIYSSDLKRCIDTANEISKKFPNVPVLYSSDLRELSYGIFEGFPYFFKSLGNRSRMMWRISPPRGENWQQMTDRLAGFLDSIYPAYADKEVLLVTHGGPISIISGLLGDSSLRDNAKAITNCSIWRWRMSEPLKLSTARPPNVR